MAESQLEVVAATIIQLYFISSCDSTAIGFKQDELYFCDSFGTRRLLKVVKRRL